MDSAQGPRKHDDAMSWPDRLQGPWRLDVRWREVDGRLECNGLEIQPLEDRGGMILTAATLRSIPLGSIIDELWRRRAAALAHDAGLPAPDASSDTYVPVFSRVEQPRPRVGRPPKYDTEHYQNVARVYSTAFAARRSPVKAVAEAYGVKHSAAAKWVSVARGRGFLPPTNAGKARSSGAPNE